MVDRVSLYRAPTTVVETDEVARWLEATAGVPVAVRDRLLADVDGEAMATAMAKARVLSPHRRETGNEMRGIVRYERRVLADPDRGGGVLYDGEAVQDAVRTLIPPEERRLEKAHVVLLDRRLATWGRHDGRWHQRVSVLGQPALVSVPGVAEAPAKPEGYYAAKGGAAAVSGDAPPREVLEAAVEGAYLREDDPRTAEAVKGYALQAVHYLATGEAFCEDPDCRLHDAHRQPALVRAQLEGPPFCERHRRRYGSSTGP